VIVDEASMLNSQLYNDLLSFNLPILFVGDPGQLPPVGDNPNVMARCDITLSKIHRQAELNPIIRFASDLRTGNMWGYGQHKIADSDVIALDIRNKSSSMDVLLEVDQVITAFNKRRLEINRLLRETYNFTEPVVIGDKLICLRNNRDKGLFNGLILKVTKVHQPTPTCYVADLIDDLGQTWSDIHMLKKGFNGGFDTKNDIFPSGNEVTLFDYGYCITCHKSQGSEWDSVLVLEQWAHEKLWSMPRWQYTAATRAAKKLIYVR
jgi:ATP-dependent exoDNAse (exonuclease V) alpha subunit